MGSPTSNQQPLTICEAMRAQSLHLREPTPRTRKIGTRIPQNNASTKRVGLGEGLLVDMFDRPEMNWTMVTTTKRRQQHAMRM